MKLLCDSPENMDARGLKSDGKHPAEAPTEATDQKVRGSNPLRRAKKRPIFKENRALLLLFCDLTCGPNWLTHILTHTGKGLDTSR